jgi:hypothetical protein
MIWPGKSLKCHGFSGFFLWLDSGGKAKAKGTKLVITWIMVPRLNAWTQRGLPPPKPTVFEWEKPRSFSMGVFFPGGQL